MPESTVMPLFVVNMEGRVGLAEAVFDFHLHSLQQR